MESPFCFSPTDFGDTLFNENEITSPTSVPLSVTHNNMSRLPTSEEDTIIVPLTDVITQCVKTSLESQAVALQGVHKQVLDLAIREQATRQKLEECIQREQRCLHREQECTQREQRCLHREQECTRHEVSYSKMEAHHTRISAQLNMFDVCLDRMCRQSPKAVQDTP